ncbi:hypothetical protein RUM8411_01883 [Ruegeria meonggei]|uniref:Uncharacterized protein n=1 Tax=Ruegeria meonggei TaxID=1446476 RepID=A0A1X6Z7H8_9RHOB|nr:hypothetical protein RUM8411_01883 [Ruegeria meonggei]
MMRNVLNRLKALWPARPAQTLEEAAETALLVYPRCC